MADPLSIIVVCRSFPAHRAGGLEWHAHDVVEGLIDAGHTVHVLTSPLPAEPALAPLRANGELVEIGRAKAGAYSRSWFRAAAPAVRGIARKHDVDLVHAQGLAGVPLVLTGYKLPPVATTVHGTLFSETPLYRRTWRGLSGRERAAALWRYKHRLGFWPVWRTWLAVRPRLIVDSRFTAHELRRADRELRPMVVPLGVDLGRYPESVIPQAEASLGSVSRLLTIARLEKSKGIDVLLKGLAGLKEREWTYTVIGDGPERAGLEAIARKLGLAERVEFAGRIASGADLFARLAGTDLFLNPDQGHPAFGLVNAEALLAGAAVLASDHGAHGEVIGEFEGCGLVGDASRPGSWTTAVGAALESLPEAEGVREARRERARERFGRERMIRRLVSRYRLWLKERGGIAGEEA